MKKITLLLPVFLFLTALGSFAQCFTTVHTRYNHNVALKPDGSIWGWGSGIWGNFNNNELDEYVPAAIVPNTGWQSVKGGTYNTFAIHSNGTLWGCGNNEYGNLGVGYVNEHIPVLTQIGTEANWKQISPSNFFTVGVRTDHTLWAWGQNMYHQLGDGTTVPKNSPVQISTDTDWRMAASSTVGASFALKFDGTIWGWGSNIAGLLGSNLLSHYTVTTLHNNDNDWDYIAVGTSHILAIKTDGTLWAWGNGGFGETADGLPPATSRHIPRQIGTESWATIAAGQNFSFGIKADGALWAWGKNDMGQLGDGTTENKPLPVQIGSDSNWESVTAGLWHAAALKTDGSLWTWGYNEYGQLGNGTTDPVLSPINIPIDGCSLAVPEVDAASLRLVVYPNPAHNSINISYKSNATVTLFDVLGRSVAIYTFDDNAEIRNLPIESYPAGVYLVVVRAEDGSFASEKLIIE